MSSSILSGRFYTDNDHELIVCGNSGEGFSVESGVRQGCPLSMLIFTLALDPLIRALTSQLEPAEVLIRTFADDIAIVAEDLDTIFREGDNTGKRVADVLEKTFSICCNRAGNAKARFPSHIKFVRLERVSCRFWGFRKVLVFDRFCDRSLFHDRFCR